MEDKPSLSELQLKLARYCAYQERCTFECRSKLDELEASEKQIEEVLYWLKDEKYLDDKRYVKAFVRGKFENKGWGRIKIATHIRQKKVPWHLVEKELASIKTEPYLIKVTDLAEKKRNSVGSDLKGKQKTIRFLASRGYEFDVINEALKSFEWTY